MFENEGTGIADGLREAQSGSVDTGSMAQSSGIRHEDRYLRLTIRAREPFKPPLKPFRIDDPLIALTPRTCSVWKALNEKSTREK